MAIVNDDFQLSELETKLIEVDFADNLLYKLSVLKQILSSALKIKIIVLMKSIPVLESKLTTPLIIFSTVSVGYLSRTSKF